MAARPESPSIGKYRLLVELGSGGMGDVFLAVAQGPKGFNKLQVVKRLRPELAQDPEFLAMFLNEARIAARLNHPNVVQTNEVSEHDDEYFIAMEYLEGQSLYGITKRTLSVAPKGGAPQRFPLAMHLHVLAEACEGLHYAHELADFDGTPLSLVHRDCSPQNMFVTYEGEVKVLDFGIAKATDSATTTRTGVLKGKVPYMPPEQLEGSNIDRRADVFAVGAMIWEAATGVRLWKGLNDIQIAHRLHHKDIPTPSSFEPGVDKKLEAICMKALAARPEERFQTAAELQAALETYVAALGGVRRRELGRHVASLFTDTRRDLRRKLEEELRDVVPSWRTLLSTSTGEVRSMSSGEHAPVSREDALALATATAVASPHARGGTPVSSVSERFSRVSSPPHESILTQRSTTMSLVPEQRPRSTRARALVLVTAAAVVASAITALVLRNRPATEVERAANAAPAKPTATEPTIEAASAIAPEPIELVDLSKKLQKTDAGAPVPVPGVKKHYPKHVPPAATTAPSPTAPAKPGKPTLDPGDPWQ